MAKTKGMSQAMRVICAPPVGHLHLYHSAGYGALAGGTRRFVACSKAYPISINRGSLQAIPVKLTPNGLGFALNPDGKGSFGAFGAIPNGTISVGYPGFAAMA